MLITPCLAGGGFHLKVNTRTIHRRRNYGIRRNHPANVKNEEKSYLCTAKTDEWNVLKLNLKKKPLSGRTPFMKNFSSLKRNIGLDMRVFISWGRGIINMTMINWNYWPCGGFVLPVYMICLLDYLFNCGSTRDLYQSK